jgi:predicted nucleic acid-binding protein
MSVCLVDTSSWVEALRVDGDAVVRSRVAAALNEGRARLADVVLLELWNGARGARERRDLSHIEAAVPRLETTGDVWNAARALARACRAAGVTVPATDLLVYACATHHGAELEHADAHFAEIRSVDRRRGPG